MPKFKVQVQTSGYATVTAETKKEADAKARERQFDAGSIQVHPWSALISTLKKVDE